MLHHNVFLAGSGGATDPYFSSVVLLLDFEGAQGSGGGTSPGQSGYFTDRSSRGNHVVSASSTFTYQSSGAAKFGSNSAKVDSGGHRGIMPNTSDWNFGTADLTVEFWLRADWTSGDGLDRAGIITWAKASNTLYGFELDVRKTGLGYVGYQIADSWGNNSRKFEGGTSVGGTGWDFYSLSRVSSVWYGHMNGVVLTQSTLTGDGCPASKSYYDPDGALFTVYEPSNNIGSYLGYCDSIRVTKGVGRYTGSSYTPPTTAFPTS